MAWKIYFWVMNVLVVGTLVMLALPFGDDHAIYPLADYIIVPVSTVQVVGLYGYAFKLPLLSERLWRLTFPVFVLSLLASLIVAGTRFGVEQGVMMPVATIFIAMLALPIFLPMLIANRLYAFRSPMIWRDAGEARRRSSGPRADAG